MEGPGLLAGCPGSQQGSAQSGTREGTGTPAVLPQLSARVSAQHLLSSAVKLQRTSARGGLVALSLNGSDVSIGLTD